MLTLFDEEAQLSTVQAEQLARLEETIERGLNTFMDVGTALIVVRDSRLYRQTHATFEDYCRQRWGMGKSRVYQIIDAAQVVDNLQKSKILDFPNESQARVLGSLPPDQQVEAWNRSTETAPNGKVTAAHVQSVVDEYEQQAEQLSEESDSYDWSEDDLDTDDEEIELPVTLIILPDELTETTEYDSDEWYTPVEFIEAAREVMGSIDLDPASSDEAQKVVQAATYYTAEDDGLEQEWSARNVWLNPPYSAPRPWVEKTIECLETGSIECAILLVNTANSPLWTRPLWNGPYAVCLLERRVRFWRPDRPDAKGFDRDQMIWYLGNDVAKFRSVFGAYGAIR